MPRMKSNRLPNMLAFNGSSDFLTLPIVPAVTGFNLAFWFIKRNHTGNARIVDWQEGGPKNGLSVYEDIASALSYQTRNSGSITGFISGKGFPNARLVHVVITFNGTTLKVYEDGVLVSTDNSSTMSLSSQVLTIAKRSTASSNFWNGELGELVLHNTTTPWTQEQITNLYYNGIIPSGASFWLFDGNVLDGSGNGNHGTLTGGTYITRNAERISGKFPVTSIIDNFNRPNAASLGSAWTDAVAGFSISGNTAVGEDADFNIATLNVAPSSADCEVYAKIANVVTGGKAGVYLRWSGGSGNGYGATVDFLEAGHSINVYRTDSFVDTTILTIAKQFVDGDSLGMQMIGSALRIYHQDGTSGTWTYLGGVIDATHSAAGALELVTKGTSVKIDSFGGGNVSTLFSTVRRNFSDLIYNGSFDFAPDFIAETSTITKFIDGTVLGNIKNYFGWAVLEKSGTCAARFIDGTMKLSTTVANANIAVSPSKSASANGVINAGIVLKPNTTYRLSGKIKTNLVGGSAATGARLFINLYNGAGSYSDTKYAKNSILTTTDWTDYSVEFTTTSSQVRGVLYLNIKGTDGAATLLMDAWFDNISLTETNNSNRVAVQPFTGSALFDGSASYITLPFTPDLTGFSVLLRAKILSGFANGSILFDWESAADRNGISLKLDTSSMLLVCVGSTATAADSILVSTTKIRYGVWYNIAFTYQQNQHRLYVNSVLEGSDTSITVTTNVTTPTLGKRSYGAVGYGKCKISDFTYTDDVLTQAEIAAYFKSGTLPTSSRNRWKLDDTAGSYVDSIAGATGTGTSMTKSTDAPTIARTAV